MDVQNYLLSLLNLNNTLILGILQEPLLERKLGVSKFIKF